MNNLHPPRLACRKLESTVRMMGADTFDDHTAATAALAARHQLGEVLRELFAAHGFSSSLDPSGVDIEALRRRLGDHQSPKRPIPYARGEIEGWLKGSWAPSAVAWNGVMAYLNANHALSEPLEDGLLSLYAVGGENYHKDLNEQVRAIPKFLDVLRRDFEAELADRRIQVHLGEPSLATKTAFNAFVSLIRKKGYPENACGSMETCFDNAKNELNYSRGSEVSHALDARLKQSGMTRRGFSRHLGDFDFRNGRNGKHGSTQVTFLTKGKTTTDMPILIAADAAFRLFPKVEVDPSLVQLHDWFITAQANELWETSTDFSGHLKALRTIGNLHLKEIAEQCSVSKTMVCFWERPMSANSQGLRVSRPNGEQFASLLKTAHDDEAIRRQLMGENYQPWFDQKKEQQLTAAWQMDRAQIRPCGQPTRITPVRNLVEFPAQNLGAKRGL